MAEVYGNAIFTLSALSSGNSTQGCRVGTPDSTIHGRHVSNFLDFDCGSYRIRLIRTLVNWHEEYGDDVFWRRSSVHNPLRRRAWALQERVLSKRNISFSSKLILWECNMMRSSSDSPWIEEVNVLSHMIWPMKAFRSEIQLRRTPDIVRQGWCDLMEDYMSRQLTKGCDKLLALSGLARSYDKKFEGSDYVAGMWTKHLPHALLWRMADDNDAQRSTAYRAPSFSFLSLDGPMRYEGQMRRPPIGDRWEGCPGDSLLKNLYILSASIKPIGLDRFGAISQASLAVRGRLMQVRLKHRDEEQEDAACRWNVLDTFDGSLLGVFFPDVTGGFVQIHARGAWL